MLFINTKKTKNWNKSTKLFKDLSNLSAFQCGVMDANKPLNKNTNLRVLEKYLRNSEYTLITACKINLR